MIDTQTWLVGCLMILAFCGMAGWMLAGTVVESVSSGGRHRSDGRPQLVLTSVRVEWVIPAAEWLRPEDAEERRRRQLHEAWMRRRAAEAPWFAQMAQQMGLGLALGVAA